MPGQLQKKLFGFICRPKIKVVEIALRFPRPSQRGRNDSNAYRAWSWVSVA
jgi:hypothetical protein